MTSHGHCKDSNELSGSKVLSFFNDSTAASTPRPLLHRGFTATHTRTHHSVGLPCTSDQPDAETSTRQHTTFTREIHPWLRQDSNPQSQQATRRRPKPLNRAAIGIGSGSKIRRYLWTIWMQIIVCSRNEFPCCIQHSVAIVR
jgi:hypothetical protein